MTDNLYLDLNTYLRRRFGRKVWKVPVDAGFTCPNRDGTKGHSGCIYCNNESFSGASAGGITEQVKKRIEALKRRNINAYIIYFQSYSNTYGTIDEIRTKIESALIEDGIVSVHIGTRPDTVDDEKLDYLAELNKKYEVVVEYGLQSSNPETLRIINRGHTAEDFADAVRKTAARGIKSCAHIILGLPNDTKADMLETVRFAAACGVHSVKFHHLHIVKDTELENIYNQGKIKVMDVREYADVLAECIALLPEETVIARLMGDAAGDTLIAPKWEISKNEFINLLKSVMREKGLRQGDSFGK
ncbi:TIGR01212 family radical SAM protein [Geovibrio thiophilus]|uniref:TIGR01212 family radical SAM protein n=2 Tax=Geovibrio thiophilus TaxID=139438 RepID=A0A410JXY3_9BACT|nr:TIGR01212 family radical SAM protein [Geovibrio thiophilus]